jgi:hypothetical protein
VNTRAEGPSLLVAAPEATPDHRPTTARARPSLGQPQIERPSSPDSSDATVAEARVQRPGRERERRLSPGILTLVPPQSIGCIPPLLESGAGRPLSRPSHCPVRLIAAQRHLSRASPTPTELSQHITAQLASSRPALTQPVAITPRPVTRAAPEASQSGPAQAAQPSSGQAQCRTRPVSPAPVLSHPSQASASPSQTRPIRAVLQNRRRIRPTLKGRR